MAQAGRGGAKAKATARMERGIMALLWRWDAGETLAWHYTSVQQRLSNGVNSGPTATFLDTYGTPPETCGQTRTNRDITGQIRQEKNNLVGAKPLARSGATGPSVSIDAGEEHAMNLDDQLAEIFGRLGVVMEVSDAEEA